MKAVFRFVWVVSCLGLLWCLFKTYSEINPKVVLFSRNMPAISRDVYFYGSASIFLLYSLLFIGLVSVVPIMPRRFILVPNRNYWFAAYKNRKMLNRILQGWIFAMAAVVNYFFMLGLMVVVSRNHLYGAMPFNGGWQLPLGFAFILSLISPFFRLTISKIDLMDNRAH